jgi:Acyl-CoA carboxylase epsilon subunit
MPADGQPGADRPVLMVIKGDASAEEIAAVVGALSVVGRSGRGGTSRPRRVGGWADRSAMLRTPLRPGPQAWRASGRPG